jgi:hypothetical protein
MDDELLNQLEKLERRATPGPGFRASKAAITWQAMM